MPEESKELNGFSEAYERIRRAILHGEIPPNSRISQVKIAEHFGLSRTPVREALRMIQKEGLITAERGRQVVIASTSVGDLDELYALRINLDTTTARMTVPLLSERDLEELADCLSTMDSHEDLDSFEQYDKAHQLFHLVIIRAAGQRHVSHSTLLNDHAERYRRLYLSQPASFEQGRKEHREIFEACAARDGDLVARLLAEHFAKIALTLVAQIDSTFEPWLVRSAVRGALQYPVKSDRSRNSAARSSKGSVSKGLAL